MVGKTYKLSRDLVLTIGSTALLLLSVFLTNIIVGKLLSQSEFGAYNVLMSFLLISVTLSLFGNNSSLIYFGGNPAIKHSKLLSKVLLFTAVLSVFISILIVLFNKPVSELLGFKQSLNLSIIAVAIPFFAINRILSGYFRSRDKIVFFSATEGSRGLFYLGITALLLFIRKDLLWAVSAIVLSEFITLIIGLILLFRCNSRVETVEPTPPLKDILKFSSHIALATFLIDLELRLGFFLIGNRAGLDQVAVFSVAFMLAQLILVLPGAIEKAISPKLTAAFFKGSSSEFEKLVNRTTLFVLIILTNIYMVTLMNYMDILGLIFPAKPQLQEGIWMFAFLGVGFLFRGSFASVATVFTCIGRPEIYSKVIPVRLALNLFLTIIFWNFFGVIGVALGMALSSILINIVFFILLGRTSKIDVYYKEIYTCLFLASSTIVAAYFLQPDILQELFILLLYNSAIFYLFRKKLPALNRLTA